jgi:hypothetical protein
MSAMPLGGNGVCITAAFFILHLSFPAQGRRFCSSSVRCSFCFAPRLAQYHHRFTTTLPHCKWYNAEFPKTATSVTVMVTGRDAAHVDLGRSRCCS